MGGKLDRIKGRIKREGNLDQVVGKVKEKAEKAMDKIKNALTGQKTSQPGGMMRMGRHRKRRGDRIARPAMLVLLPCLCDLNGLTTGRHEAYWPPRASQ